LKEEQNVKKIFIIVTIMALMGIFTAFATFAKEEKHPNVPTAQQMNFVGDKGNMVYHFPTCKKCPKDAKIVVPLDSPLSATRAGFKPCKTCHPPKN
jgi:methylphosphotriester-DNA--protein-cysteine methyltransferase